MEQKSLLVAVAIATVISCCCILMVTAEDPPVIPPVIPTEAIVIASPFPRNQTILDISDCGLPLPLSPGLTCEEALFFETVCTSSLDCGFFEYCCNHSCNVAVCTAGPGLSTCVTVGGLVLFAGESFIADDGCNLCVCLPTGISCSEGSCAPPVPRVCPRISSDATTGACNEATCDSLSDNTTCGQGQLCCNRSGCPLSCLQSVSVCQDFGGTLYNGGDVFPLGDGCNNCTCLDSGRVNCTSIDCFEACITPPLNASCRMPGTRYYYDAMSAACLNFTGGCGAKSFSSARDCYDRCDPITNESECYYDQGESKCTCNFYGEMYFNKWSQVANMCNGAVPEVSTCSQIASGWTFDSLSGRCMEVNFPTCIGSVEYYRFETMEACLRTCVDPSFMAPECPNELSSVLCFINPCFFSSCPNSPSARCVPSFCGGCNAHYFDDDGNNVTDSCRTRETCPDGSELLRCFLDPCEVVSCPGNPTARCVSNFCGNCSYIFVDSSNNDVTSSCGNTRSQGIRVPLTEAMCPNVDSAIGGICTQSCSSNINCTGEQICCPNGCGTSCRAAIEIPYYRIPPVCPETDLRDLFSICPITDQSCSRARDCSENQLCCRDICGQRCMDSARSSTPCYAVQDHILESVIDISLAGDIYYPTCALDGTFEPIQCNTTTQMCWCVDMNTGRPVSSLFPPRVQPSCQSCTFEGNSYRVGETFPAADGCNQCECSGVDQVRCTSDQCQDTCSLPADPGPCRASIQAFYYDQASSRCRPFVYGGCEGNANKFESVRDCLMICDPQNACNQLPLPCDTLGPSFSFNITTGRCEKINFGICGISENSFSSGSTCLEQCSPGGIAPTDVCLDVFCVAAICPPGTETVNDDEHCCPYCSPIVQCRSDQYRCSDGTCIPNDRFCDRLNDCSDGADEEFCPQECEFTCGDRTCIRSSQVCDGIIDCNDGADIRNCSDNIEDVFYLATQDIPTTCPDTSDSLGVCVQECSSNADCMNGKLCCSNGCGRTCVEGVISQIQSLCTSVLRSTLGAVGIEFELECDDEGDFSQVQCSQTSNSCWCVDTVGGQPITEGVIGTRPDCRGCTTPNGEDINLGESYRTEDGCNICACTEPETVICTLRQCDTAPCVFNGRVMASNSTVDDGCNSCLCFAGTLTCVRRNCSEPVVMEGMRRSVRARLPFNGDYDSIINNLDDFKREVIRSFLDKYQSTMGMTQAQIRDIEVLPGSVIVEMTLEDSNTTLTGANVSLLLGQVQSDFDAGIFVIRYDNEVFMPSGRFGSQDVDTQEQGSSNSLVDWHIALITLAGVALVAITVTSITVLTILQKAKPKPSVAPQKIVEDTTSKNGYVVDQRYGN